MGAIREVVVSDSVPRWSGQCEASDLQQLRHALVGPQGPHVQAVVVQQGHQLQLVVNTHAHGVWLGYETHRHRHSGPARSLATPLEDV